MFDLTVLKISFDQNVASPFMMLTFSFTIFSGFNFKGLTRLEEINIYLQSRDIFLRKHIDFSEVIIIVKIYRAENRKKFVTAIFSRTLGHFYC